MPLAVETGFRRAFPAIRDSNISTLITCAILAFFGTDVIRGFAITLAIGVVVDDVLPRVAAGHDVVDGAVELDSQASWHARSLGRDGPAGERKPKNQV